MNLIRFCVKKIWMMQKVYTKSLTHSLTHSLMRFSRAGPRGRGTEWATLGVHPLSWLLSNNRLEKVPFVSVLHTSSNRLLLSNQDKGCTPSVAHSLPLPLGPALLNLWTHSLTKHAAVRSFLTDDLKTDYDVISPTLVHP